jgi:hypothetical protein
MKNSVDGTPTVEWPRSDSRYRQVARALIGSLILSVAFCLYSFITKEVRWLYVTEPWRDDPYDALRSFDFVAVTVPTVLAAWRFALSGTAPRVSVQRIVDLTRACYLLAGLILVMIASEWLSVVLRTHVDGWNTTTFMLIWVLAAFTVATLAVFVLLAIARRALASVQAPGRPDWLDDGVYFLRICARIAGPARRSILAAAHWIDRFAAGWIRRYPLTFLCAVAVLLAIIADTNQIVQEGYTVDFAIYFLTVSATGYYAFFAIVSRYLNLIAIPPLTQHPARFAGITTAASIPLTEAFRQYLSWVIGVRGDIETPAQLYLLTAVIAAATATVTLITGLITSRTTSTV